MGFKRILGDLRGDFCNMVLLQRGTTRLAGRVDAVKNENIPSRRKSAKRRGLHSVYCAVYVLYTLYSLLLAMAVVAVGVVCVVVVGLSVQTRPHTIDC